MPIFVIRLQDDFLTFLSTIHQEGKTPLHFAAQAGHVKIVHYLLNKEVDIHHQNKVLPSLFLLLTSWSMEIRLFRLLVPMDIWMLSMRCLIEAPM
jgi:ankyrin repeat protein